MFRYYIRAKDLKVDNIITYNSTYYKVMKIEQDTKFPDYLTISLWALHIDIFMNIEVNWMYMYIEFVAHTSKEIVWINV